MASEEPADTIASAAAPMPAFRYGDRLRFTAKLKRPRNFRNPGRLRLSGISRRSRHRRPAKIENVERHPGFSGSRIAFWRSWLQRAVIAKVHELWPPHEAALIDAMVIGEEAFIDRDTQRRLPPA